MDTITEENLGFYIREMHHMALKFEKSSSLGLTFGDIEQGLTDFATAQAIYQALRDMHK